MKKGFTLLELIIVIIIIGVLATLGFTQYTKVIEKGRTTEAKAILGSIRTAQQAYNLEWGGYTATLANLVVEAPGACTVTHYYSYSVTATTGTATRCTAANGKQPGAATAYTVTLTYDTGAWGGTAGYY